MINKTQAIKINPHYAKAYYNRGLAYKELNKYQAATADYQKAAQLLSNRKI
ncbi:MAG: tetratricopeptide repeat protein [Waterburya sp.]